MTSPVLLFSPAVTSSPLGGGTPAAGLDAEGSGADGNFLLSFLQAAQQSCVTANGTLPPDGQDAFMIWQSPDGGDLLDMAAADVGEFVSDFSAGLDATLLHPADSLSLEIDELTSKSDIGSNPELAAETVAVLTNTDEAPVTDGIPAQLGQLPLVAAESVENPAHSLPLSNLVMPTSQPLAIPSEPSVMATAGAEFTQSGKRLDLTQWLSRDTAQMEGDTMFEDELKVNLLPKDSTAIGTSDALLKNTLFARAQASQVPFAVLDAALPEQPTVESARPVSSMPGGPMAAEIINNARVTLPLQVTFGHPQWSEALAERAGLLAYQKIHTADIQLDPPELGPLQMKISVHQDQAVVTFVSANAQVRDLLDQNLVRLRELLQEQGLQLVDAGVSDHQRESNDDAQASMSDLSDASVGDETSNNAAAAETSTQTELAWGVDDFV